MRIALIAPVWFPVPPMRYGGIERVVGLLADGLLDAGHDVIVFGSGDSRTRAKLRYLYEEAPSTRIGQLMPELQHALFAHARLDGVDLVHDHTNALGAALGGLATVPFLHTVHGNVDGSTGDMYESVVRLAPRTRLIAVSCNQRRHRPDLPWLATCHNAVDLRAYPFPGRDRLRERGRFLVFLGRMGHDKGAHRAIEVARAVGLPLKIAAKCIEPEEHAYFRTYVAPHLGPHVEFLGEVTHAEKVDLLRHARAFLHPIAWEEPFGLAMIEAMACGTPVIAVRRGSVPEIVEDGRNGFTVNDHVEMADVVGAVDSLDPSEVRASVEERFSLPVFVANHIRAYAAVLRDSSTRDKTARAASMPDASAP